MNVGQILEVHLGWAATARQADPGRRSRAACSAQDARSNPQASSTANDDVDKFIDEARRTTKPRRSRSSFEDGRPLRDAGVRRRDESRRSRSALDARGSPDERSDDRSSTAAPAKRSSRTSPWASCTCSSSTTWSTTRSTRVASGRTRSSRSSRWVAKRSSVVSVSERWKSGRWKPTAPPTRCRSS